MISKHARAADLVIAYPTRGQVDRTLYATPDALVMETGLPVLLLPRKERAFRADRILVAWKNTRESRRALSTTLPLLKQSGRVLIAAICGTWSLPTSKSSWRMWRSGLPGTASWRERWRRSARPAPSGGASCASPKRTRAASWWRAPMATHACASGCSAA